SINCRRGDIHYVRDRSVAFIRTEYHRIFRTRSKIRRGEWKRPAFAAGYARPAQGTKARCRTDIDVRDERAGRGLAFQPGTRRANLCRSVHRRAYRDGKQLGSKRYVRTAKLAPLARVIGWLQSIRLCCTWGVHASL